MFFPLSFLQVLASLSSALTFTFFFAYTNRRASHRYRDAPQRYVEGNFRRSLQKAFFWHRLWLASRMIQSFRGSHDKMNMPQIIGVSTFGLFTYAISILHTQTHFCTHKAIHSIFGLLIRGRFFFIVGMSPFVWSGSHPSCLTGRLSTSRLLVAAPTPALPLVPLHFNEPI